jgi:signal transduction histidine kinase
LNRGQILKYVQCEALDIAPKTFQGKTHAMSNSKLKAGRTLALAAMLVAIFVAAIAIVCALAALGGYILTRLGVMTFEELTHPAAIITTVVLGAAVLAAIVCVTINYTLVSPLRRMTQAMNHLAEGNFSYRVQPASKKPHIREVDEFAASFNTAAAELEGTEIMRTGFISDFSHEFRTPISSISGFAQLLMEDDLDPEERREYLQIVYDESQRLAGLSERILLLSKMDATTILPDVEPVNITEQLRRAVALMQQKLQDTNVSVDISADECSVPGNANYLSQLWINLIDNAIKFSPAGGRISIAVYAGQKDGEGNARAASSAVVWISDEGPGMDAATVARVFDRFYQADSSHAFTGNGLGLALCKRVVQLHGGEISVQSTQGAGTTFEVRLPQA